MVTLTPRPSRYDYQHATTDGCCCTNRDVRPEQVSTLMPRNHFCLYRLDSVRHIILDEADRMLDTEFLDQVQEVVAACTHTEVQKAVFSATLPANAEKIAMGMLHDPIRVVVGLKYVRYHLTLHYWADSWLVIGTHLSR